MGFVVFAFRNWKLVLAGLGVVGMLMTGAGLYMKGRADKARQIEMAAAKENLNRIQRQLKVDREAALDNARKARELQSKVEVLDDYIENLQSRDHQCLDGNDTDRLRKLWGQK